ncbi:MAG: hypothetical protein NZ750_06025 [Anaerolineae bacterium]|nr:hypothetical protein [Anaerolineae bacterium]MDW8173005.1 hypothetical protein [Anaerolineae bacterium]
MDNLEPIFIGFLIVTVVLAIVSSAAGNVLYRQRQQKLDRLEQAQPQLSQLSLNHPLRLMLAEIERDKRQLPAPAYPFSNEAIVIGLTILLFVVSGVLFYLLGTRVSDQVMAELSRLNLQLVRQVEYFLRIREIPYHRIDLDTVVPIVAITVLMVASPILLYLLVWLVRTLWRIFTWSSVEGYVLEVDSHSEVKVMHTGKSSSHRYYHATELAALYRDKNDEPQVAYSRAEGWRRALRAAQRYRVGQRVALRVSRGGRYALFGRVLEDDQTIGSSPLVTRI